MSLLVPQRWKFRKVAIWRLSGVASNATDVVFWDFWMKAVSNGYISSRQIESARKVIIRYIRKTWKMWLRIFPDVPVTKKPLEVKMGAWKWSVDRYVARVRRWRMIFEINWVTHELAKEIFKQASYKLPIATRTVAKWEIN